jgi:hypothetical protein
MISNLANLRAENFFLYKNSQEIINLEKKYGKFCFVPLDIPVISDNTIVDNYFEIAKQVTKIKKDVASNIIGSSNFLSLDYSKNLDKTKYHVWTRTSSESNNLKLKNLLDQLYAYLPFTYIENFSLWSSLSNVNLHRDRAIFFDIPNSFRINLYDSNIQPTLFLEEFPSNKLDSVEKDRFFIPKFEYTNTFIWNNYRTKHGSFFTPPGRKILLIVGQVIIDWKKYDILLERSISKYKNNLMESCFNFSDF